MQWRSIGSGNCTTGIDGSGLAPYTGGRALDSDPPKPSALAALIDAAERFAANVDHLRVDLYEIDGVAYFGEATVYPSSGHKAWIERNAVCDPHPPLNIDRQMGDLWSLPPIPRRTILRRGLLG